MPDFSNIYYQKHQYWGNYIQEGKKKELAPRVQQGEIGIIKIQ